MKRSPSWQNGILILTTLLIVLSMAFPSNGGEERKIRLGFSLLAGPNADFIHGRPTLTQLAILPRINYPLHRKWDFELEGTLSYYGIKHEKNLYVLGTNVNILFKPLEGKGWKWFLVGGVGAGYNNSNGRIRYIGKSHVAGILHIGTGMDVNMGKGYFLRGEYRLEHLSDPFNHDEGINTHCFMLGVSY